MTVGPRTPISPTSPGASSRPSSSRIASCTKGNGRPWLPVPIPPIERHVHSPFTSVWPKPPGWAVHGTSRIVTMAFQASEPGPLRNDFRFQRPSAFASRMRSCMGPTT
jgi:hypothetical protein